MQSVLPSGSNTIAMRQMGVGNGSMRKETLLAFKCAIAASKSSTSSATEQPSGLGIQPGALPMASA